MPTNRLACLPNSFAEQRLDPIAQKLELWLTIIYSHQPPAHNPTKPPELSHRCQPSTDRNKLAPPAPITPLSSAAAIRALHTLIAAVMRSLIAAVMRYNYSRAAANPGYLLALPLATAAFAAIIAASFGRRNGAA